LVEKFTRLLVFFRPLRRGTLIRSNWGINERREEGRKGGTAAIREVKKVGWQEEGAKL
jgi:hypothetical protein